MRKLADLSRSLGYYFSLFLIAQVITGVLVVVTIHTAGRFSNADRHPSLFSKDVLSSLTSSRPTSGGLLDDDASRQLKFVQNEESWLSLVYHEEDYPALKNPKEAFPTSIPLSDFCPASARRVSKQYAVFRNAMFVGRTLLLPSSTDCRDLPLNLNLQLGTSFHKGQNSTPPLEVRVVPLTDNFEDFNREYVCQERVYEPSVLFSFINWPQHGHAIFNTISLLWEAFQHPQTGPLLNAGKNVRLYAYGDAKVKDERQELQQYLPFFDVDGVGPLMSMFSHQPVRSLANMLYQSERHPICFSYLVAGISGSEIDHYNFNVSLSKWRDFSHAVREHFGVRDTPRLSYGRPLERVAPKENEWLSKNDISVLPQIRPIDWGQLEERPRLVIIDRKDNRMIINVKQLLQIAKSTSYFKSAEVVYLEDMPIQSQIRLIGETDVLFGMDGTGLMNGIFMPEGGIVVHVRPYGCAEFLPGKGTNFDRLWSANPGRVIRYESDDKSTTRFPQNIKERPELVFSQNSTEAYRFPFLLRQDTRIDPVAFQCILASSDKLLHGQPVDWQHHKKCTRSVFT